MSLDPEISKSEERFELLSAYLDNEVSAAEKLQVEQWLAQDLKYRRQYQQLCKIKRLLIDLPVPASQKVDSLVSEVMVKIEKRSRRRLAWGGMIASVLIGTVSSIFAIDANHRWSIANQTEHEQLILAMERPIIPLPQLFTEE